MMISCTGLLLFVVYLLCDVLFEYAFTVSCLWMCVLLLAPGLLFGRRLWREPVRRREFKSKSRLVRSSEESRHLVSTTPPLCGMCKGTRATAVGSELLSSLPYYHDCVLQLYYNYYYYHHYHYHHYYYYHHYCVFVYGLIRLELRPRAGSRGPRRERWVWGEVRGSRGRGFEHRSTRGVWACEESRAKHDEPSCYWRPPFLGTPLISSRMAGGRSDYQYYYYYYYYYYY